MIILLVMLFILPPQFGVLARSTIVEQHYTDLTWLDLSNPAGVSYNVYRSVGPCGASTTFDKIASNISSGPAGLSYRDYDVATQTYKCYYVTTTSGTVESEPSEKVTAKTP